MEYDLKEMLQINEVQKDYYEISTSKSSSTISKYWAQLRTKYHSAASEFGIYADLYNLHRSWLGNLGDKNVLDLGCHVGNPISLEIASNAKSYLGVDLSESAIELLRKKLLQLPNADAIATDFLSPTFQDTYTNKFDIIYAHSVAHHFKFFDRFLGCLANCLAPNGKIITYDPMQTSLTSRLTRQLYRPFQPDRAWEYPFDRASFKAIEKWYEIKAVQGIFAKSKWAIPIYLINQKFGKDLGVKLHGLDKEHCSKINKSFWHSLHVTMLWE